MLYPSSCSQLGSNRASKAVFSVNGIVGKLRDKLCSLLKAAILRDSATMSRVRECGVGFALDDRTSSSPSQILVNLERDVTQSQEIKQTSKTFI